MAGLALMTPKLFMAADYFDDFPVVRVPASQRHFSSPAIENAIKTFSKKVKNKELAWLFNNCFPNTLDTTVDPYIKDGVNYTYVITGDIDAMWLRDSSAQVWPYLHFMKKDPKLQLLIQGLIRKQSECINLDPYANAFYNDPTKKSEWDSDLTTMKPGVHERKWEIDSLCYPIRLAYHYWKISGDTDAFDDEWLAAQKNIYKTFVEQQRKDGLGPYHFQRVTAVATDTVPMGGYGYPTKPDGLICSAFRPSDDATVYSYLIPSNLFAVVSLRQSAEILRTVKKENQMADQFLALADEVEKAVKQHGIVTHPEYGKIYAFEVDGFGSQMLMDDANVPSLLSLPYLEAVDASDPVYQNTRKYVWSKANPFFFKGSAGEGIGGPHVGLGYIWPIAITIRGLTSNNDEEIRDCIRQLQKSNAGTGFMHESFYKDDVTKFTRKWFAWANTLFGEFLWKIFEEKPELLS